MNTIRISRIGIITEGIASWSEALAVLRNQAPYQGGELPPLKPATLKPNERRRTTRTIKLALQATEEALQDCPDTQNLLSVFSSSEGDLDIIDQICRALSQPDRPVSPTQFHNSVHNAPAGYWSIGSGSLAGSNSLAGLDGGFAAGLIDAATLVLSEQQPVLLTCYDQLPPTLLQDVMPIKTPFAVALMLIPESPSQEGLARLELRLDAQGEADVMADHALERLRRSAPAARCLPLLQALAQIESPRQCRLTYLPGLNLQVSLSR
ncbi:MAG: beta-ketoacyl synthase chain length factor [Candidatus Thiodiazotropha sp.]